MQLPRCILRASLALALLAAVGCATARADAALLVEEPYGDFGFFNPTGHAAIYLSRVCADTPTHLRPCRPGELGVVLSRYHHIDGYDWLAIPLIPYLYAVDDPSEIPATATPRLERKLRDTYRRNHLQDLVPDDPKHEIPGGEWIQLVGASYDRRIWGYEVATTDEQDLDLIERFNDRRNVGHFNLLFNNCANFTQKVLNYYYPHSIHRNFIADGGMMTPKQAAKSLVKYSRKHPDADLLTFVIPQVPGTIKRSTPVDGVAEALVKSKKYVVPLAVLNPYLTGTLIAAYLGQGRFHPDPNAVVYNPAADLPPRQEIRREISAGDSLDLTTPAREEPSVRETPTTLDNQQ
jgi:hypothetical protein